jgi:hypothetical protein
LKIPGSIPERVEKFFFSSKCSFHFWGPPSLLFKDTRGFSPLEQSGSRKKLTIYILKLVPRLRKIGGNIYSVKGHQL